MNIWDSYFEWLLKRLNLKKRDRKKLLHILFDRPFDVILDRDYNRLEDGRYLRNHFLLECGINGGFTDHYISVLEVLIALCERIELEYIGNPSDPRPDIIFWEILCNLGLDRECFSDSRINHPTNLRKIDEIVNVFVNREYDFNGNGGLFPLKVNDFDQKDVEIWDQMQAYLSENYGDFW